MCPTQNCILALLLLGCQIIQSPGLPCVTGKAFSSVLWLFFSSFWILYSLDYTLSLQNLVANSTPVFLWLPSVTHFCITITNSAALSSACFSSWFINIQLSCEQADVKFLIGFFMLLWCQPKEERCYLWSCFWCLQPLRNGMGKQVEEELQHQQEWKDQLLAKACPSFLSRSVPSPRYLDYGTDKKLHLPQAEEPAVLWSQKSTETESKTFLCLILINSDSNAKLWNKVTSWGWGTSPYVQVLGCGTTCSMKYLTLLLCILSDVRKLAVFFFNLLRRSSDWFKEKCLIKFGQH